MADQNDAMISSLIDYMQEKGLVLTTAESCTAGLILSEFAGAAAQRIGVAGLTGAECERARRRRRRRRWRIAWR